MTLLAVSVLGHDRPGIIADVTDVLARLGGNLEDSTMTILRGHFAMTLLVSGAAAAAEVEDELQPLTADGSLLVSVREVAPEPDPAGGGSGHVLTVHGADRAGIVSAVTRVLADAGGNVTDLTTRLAGTLYLLVAEVDLPPAADADALAARLGSLARELGVEASLRPAEPDVL
ncbi:MAG: ACT domain-containing protein [Actinomycetota bacterium]|nr:ACT domain-containing protein [Actinomycetota bacterium]